MSTQPPATKSDETMWDTLLHSGIVGTFLRLPHVAPEAGAVGNAGAAIYGMPWDSMQICRSGASYGPRQIREISAQMLTYNATWGFDIVDALHPVDCGDCHVIVGNAERTFERAQADLGQILEAGAIPVVLGGDHSVTIPAVRAVKQHHENPGLVLFDAHLDTALEVGGEPLSNCCPITRAIDAGFDPRKTVLVGISGWMNPRTELEYCREQGITVIWLEDLWERGVERVIAETLEIAGGDEGLYMTVDVDALDGAYAPGTSAPAPGGMTSRELLLLVRGIAQGGLVGLDVVETAPSLEGSTSMTASIAGRVVLDALAAHAGALAA